MSRKRRASSLYSNKYPVVLLDPKSMNLSGSFPKVLVPATPASGFTPSTWRTPVNTSTGSFPKSQPKAIPFELPPISVSYNPTQNVSRRVSSQRAYLAGKIRKFKKTSRKISYRKKGKKRTTRLGLSSKGVHVCQEIRFTSKTDTATKYESLQIGHTSMPCRTVLMGLCRALVKYITKSQCILRNFTDNMYNAAGGYQYTAGDVFRFDFYGNWDSNTLNNFFITLPAVATYTFEEFAQALYQQLRTYSTPASLNIRNLRWERMEYQPVGLSQYAIMSVNLRECMVEFSAKSSLKVQNRTINTVGNDEANDVDNVPIQGFVYHCKGNNLFNKTNRRILQGVSTGDLLSNDIILFDHHTRAQPSSSPEGEWIQTDPNQSAFSKVSEPPKPYEIQNCKKSHKIRINPGGIKTSVLTQKFKLPLQYVIQLLCDDAQVDAPFQKYDPRKGLCRVMHLEKVIGSTLTSVAISAEVQYDLWISVTGTPAKTYTNPVLLQADYGTFP